MATDVNYNAPTCNYSNRIVAASNLILQKVVHLQIHKATITFRGSFLTKETPQDMVNALLEYCQSN